MSIVVYSSVDEPSVMESTGEYTDFGKTESRLAQKPPALPLRIGFWGTRAAFSNTVLTALLKLYPIAQVAFPAATPGVSAVEQWLPPASSPPTDDLLLIPRSVAPDTLQTAWQYYLPTYQLSRLHAPEVAAWLAGLALDVICVACFPWRIPATLLALPTYGFLNVHPSLLPAYRGPVPLFWQLRAGVDKLGVTIHWMDSDFDTGAIAAQQRVDLPDGITGPVADQLCAQTGASLLDNVLQQLAHGVPPRHAQPNGGSYQSWPTAADFRLCATWSARHAYNFMCATAEWRQPYPITVGDEEILLHRALAYEAEQTQDSLITRNGFTVLIQLQPGVLRAVPWQL